MKDQRPTRAAIVREIKRLTQMWHVLKPFRHWNAADEIEQEIGRQIDKLQGARRNTPR